MPTLHAVSRARHGALRWTRYRDFGFAARDPVAPLVVQEIALAALAGPVGFICGDAHFTPVAVQGLEPGRNLLVDAAGIWTGDYVPAVYRSYPFVLGRAEDAQQVLCVNEASGLVAADGEAAFFDAAGQPSAALCDVRDFLTEVERNRAVTAELCALLARHCLIAPWPLETIDATDPAGTGPAGIGPAGTGPQTVTGLYRIDEAALNALPDTAFAEIRQAGALPLVYAQLLSLRSIDRLARLATARRRQATVARPAKEPADLAAMFGLGGETLRFDF